MPVLPDMTEKRFVIDDDILKALQEDHTVWETFQTFPTLYQHVRIDGKTKIYGVMRMRSYIRPEWKLDKSTSIYLNAGMESFHSVRLSDRSIKGFKNTFSGKEKWRFDKGPYMSVGLSLYPFKQ